MSHRFAPAWEGPPSPAEERSQPGSEVLILAPEGTQLLGYSIGKEGGKGSKGPLAARRGFAP